MILTLIMLVIARKYCIYWVWNTLVILDWLTKKARLNSKRTIDACKNTINRRLQSLWKDSYRNRKIFVWICLKAVEFAFEINRPLKITMGQRFCGHHFSRKFSYLYFYSVRYVYISITYILQWIFPPIILFRTVIYLEL